MISIPTTLNPEEFFKELRVEMGMFCQGQRELTEFYSAVIDTCERDPKMGLAAAAKALEQAENGRSRLLVTNGAIALGMAMTILVLSRSGRIKR